MAGVLADAISAVFDANQGLTHKEAQYLAIACIFLGAALLPRFNVRLPIANP